MIFLSMIQKNFGYKPILKGFSMSVHPGEKIGLIGPNGSGKTTLIKMIVGEETPDQGTISVAGNPRFGYLHQIPQGDVALTVRQRLLQGIDHLVKMEEALRSLEAQMSELNPGNNEAALLMAQYDQLLAQFERLGGYQYESKIDSVVQGLGLTVPWESLLGDLSGGERARLELAVVLLSEPDVLLLDEPTNHLDFPALTWLENYISSFRGTALIISHDRYFLDRTVEKIVELDKGVAREFAGNYSFYLEERDRLYIQESKQYDTQQKEIRRKEEAIKRLRQWGAQSDNPKFFKRAASMEKQLAKVERLDRPDDGEVGFSLQFAAERSGKEVVVLRNMSHGFEGQWLFENVDWQIRYGQRIGIVGPNGSGKTTLIKMILGEVPPQLGEVVLGAGLKIGYLAQHQEQFEEDGSLLDALRKLLPTAPQYRVRAILAKYGFPGDEVFRPVTTLSGGERVRFHLMKMVHSQVNFLILDEPTNHLDLASIEVLEEALEDYMGTLLVVSHDRFFLNKAVEMIYAIEDKGLVCYLGNYEYYRKKLAEREAERLKSEVGASPRDKLLQPKPPRPRTSRLSCQALEKKLTALENTIAELEARQGQNQKAMANPDKASDYLYLSGLQEENRALQTEIDLLLQRWEKVAGLFEDKQV